MKHSEVNWAKIIDLGLLLVGKPYNLGAEVNLKNSNPDDIKSIDCSELVEWLFAQIGIVVPDGSYNQAKFCNRLPPGEAPLVGDLGFKWDPDTHAVHHVGVYIGDDNVLEAKGKQWGVLVTTRGDYEKSTHFAFWGRVRGIENA
jgi:cell wall-associated NlpC family hydrolase